MFSFQIGVALQEEEASSAESATLLEYVKAKLQEVLSLLNQDIGQLVRDAKPIREILETLEGQLPDPIEEALILAAYIESHRVQVLKAQKRLADRFQQEQIIEQKDDLKSLVDSIRSEIDSLNQSQAGLKKTKDRLEAKRDFLLQELD